MKAKDLIKMLKENPEFEVELNMIISDNSKLGYDYHTFKIIGVDDIGFSDKKIKLGFKEI